MVNVCPRESLLYIPPVEQYTRKKNKDAKKIYLIEKIKLKVGPPDVVLDAKTFQTANAKLSPDRHVFTTFFD